MKKGDKGAGVIQLQKMLNVAGAKLVTDGDFGNLTQKALEKFQSLNCKEFTKVADSETIEALRRKAGILQGVEPYLLDTNQYVNSASKKTGVCLHHTASGGNAYSVAKYWDNDSRGRVATHFVVGDDGKILQCMPLDCWGYHIATSRMGFGSSHSEKTNQRYIGIEICNWGYLEKKGEKYYNYVNREVTSNEVVKLDEPFRSYEYWHRYTDAQVQSTRWLLKALKEHFNFTFEKLPLNPQWLDLSWEALAHNRVLTTHNNFEYGKADCSPQPNFFKMIKDV